MVKCIATDITLNDLPSGYSEPAITLPSVPGTLITRIVQINSYTSIGQITVAIPDSDKLWVTTQASQSVFRVTVLQFYT